MLVRFLRLLLLVFVCLPAIAVAAGPAADARNLKPVAATGGEKRVALVIGNNAYQTVSKLEKAANDARAVGRALEQAGFRTRSVIDGNRTQMNMAINQFVEEVAGGGIGVFFFAGHGVQVNNQNFLIPVDLPQIAREADIADHGISLQILQDKIADARAKFSLLVVDACRDNPLPKKAGRSVGAMRGLTQASSAEGQMVVFSAGANQQALDKLSPNDANPNGVFTREFLPWVTQPGVTIRDAVLSVRSAVRAKAKTVDHDQFPAIYDQAEGNFYFIFQGSATENVESPTTPTPAPRVKTAAEREDELWDSIKDAESTEALNEYIKQYPQGRFAGQAKVLLAKLKPRLPLALPQAPAEQGDSIVGNKRNALLIGNAKYERGPLKTPVRDVRATRIALEELGFRVTEILDADKAALLAGINSFRSRLEREKPDLVLVFYAGHSILTRRGEDLILPIGFSPRSESITEDNSVALFDVYRQLGLANSASVNLLIHDGDRTSPFSPSKGVPVVRDYSVPNTLFIFSTKPGGTAHDGDENSPFTKALSVNLRRSNVELKEVIRGIRNDVKKETKGQQEVVVNGDMLTFPEVRFSTK